MARVFIVMRIKRLINRLPVLRWRQDVRMLYHVLEQRDATIKDDGQKIKQLEDRNDEWAAEVRHLRHDDERYDIIWPVSKQDLIDANPLRGDKTSVVSRRSEKKENLSIAWVIPSAGDVSGGHTTILRLVQYLEMSGHTCDLYIYDPQKTSSFERNQQNLKHYPRIEGNIYYNQPIRDMYDVAFATSWHTAYPLYNATISAKKCYFVQDFEPFFDPVGSYSTLAENTYRFGFYGIAMGRWLAEKLSSEYDMSGQGFDLGVNTTEYFVKEPQGIGKRNKIVFYARPVTPRRGFELGVLALEIFAKRHPEYEIHFVGWDTARYNIPFKYTNHGVMSINELNDLYNECAAGLVLSFTNMSLLPLELYAAGCIPIVNEAPHTTSVGYSDVIEYAQPYPAELAMALERVVTGKSTIDTMTQQAYIDTSWEKIFLDIEKAISHHVRSSAK